MPLTYERLVGAADAVEAELSDRFGLVRREGSPGLHAISANSAAMKDEFDADIFRALHGIRDMDPESVGKWRGEPEDPAAPLLADPEIRPVFLRYASRHGYAGAIES